MLTTKKIIDYIKQTGQAGATDMADFLGISRQALYKHISKLLNQGLIAKIGKPPKVYYIINQPTVTKQVINFPDETKKIIQSNFLIITPAGERKEGVDGFIYWCDKNNLPYQKTADKYNKTLQKYSAYKKNDFIDGMDKMRNSFAKVFLDKIFYLDFYSIERFGKTKLGQLLLYAKQSQNIELIKEIVQIAKPSVENLINKFNIDGIGFVPPTVKRERQLMRYLEKGLALNTKKIKITKIRTQVIIPQKTLSKIEDRIENASKTFSIDEKANYNNILLIDDAVGSGSTLNEIAKKIRDRNICKGKIVGLALTGSFKGFDVISEI